MPEDTIPLISPAASSSELSLTSLPTLTCFALGINDFTSEPNAFPISTAVSPARSLPATPLISYSLKIADGITALRLLASFVCQDTSQPSFSALEVDQFPVSHREVSGPL